MARLGNVTCQEFFGGASFFDPRGTSGNATWQEASGTSRIRKSRRKTRNLLSFSGKKSMKVSASATAEQNETNGDVTQTGPPSPPPSLTISVISSLSMVGGEEWDKCAREACGEGRENPFLSHAFLLSLEESKSACHEKGWIGQHLIARTEGGEVVGVAPLYLKSHSYGEYVFDHSWASAYSRFGRSYYPKLQSAVPFTPCSGPRLLSKGGGEGRGGMDVRSALADAMRQITDQLNVSSLHATFPNEEDWNFFESKGFLKRMGMQYHWSNRGYGKFDDFLMDLKQGKRKNIRQERKKVVAQDLVLKRLRGDDIKSRHWDDFYTFYRNTTDNKWGQAYLTREFFHMMGERMGDKVLLVMAEHDGKSVAGALNLIGGDTLFGRNWGCQPGKEFPYLHFEACYYQAIEAAIEWGLERVEAGAQGEHKIQRGYLPSPTFSSHYLPDPNFREAVDEFLRRETMRMKMTLAILDEDANPFKEGVLKKNE